MVKYSTIKNSTLSINYANNMIIKRCNLLSMSISLKERLDSININQTFIEGENLHSPFMSFKYDDRFEKLVTNITIENVLFASFSNDVFSEN